MISLLLSISLGMYLAQTELPSVVAIPIICIGCIIITYGCIKLGIL